MNNIETGDDMFMGKTAWRWTLTVLAIVTAIGLISGCSSKSVLEDSPSYDNAVVSVSASPSSVAVNSTSVVEATITNNGLAVTDAVVHFSVSPTGSGYFTPDTAVTDANGVAGVIFTATTSGSALVTASASIGTSNPQASTSMSVTDVQQTPEGNVDITVSQNLLLANGTDTTAIQITVRDGLGQPVADSTMLVVVAGEKFVDVDGNGYWSDGIDSLIYDANGNGQWDSYGLAPFQVWTTGGTGNAQLTYVAGNEAATVYLKVTVSNPDIGGSAEVPIQLSPDADISSIFLSSDSINLVVKGTGGIETAMLYATGYDNWGNTVPEGMTIEFIITDGPGGGEQLDTVGLGPYSAITNGQGVASVPIHSGTASGTIRVRAYNGTVLSEATQVMVSSGPPAYVVVAAEDCNVPWWKIVGAEQSIVAVVSDIYLNPVNDSTVVYFSTDEGSMKSHEARTTNLEGVVRTKWISGNNVDTADGVVAIMAETAGGTVADTSFFYNSDGPYLMTVTGMPTTMPADGVTKAVVFVSAVDINGNPVVDGTAFKADATYVNPDGGSFSDGCIGSSDRVKIKSTTLDVDNSMTGTVDDGIGAIDNIYYWSGSASITVSVALTTGTAYSASSSLSGASTLKFGETGHYSALIADRWGNPLGDHTLNMTAASGVVGGASQNTNAYGEATGFTWTPADTGTYNIVVTDTDPRGSGLILTKSISVTF